MRGYLNDLVVQVEERSSPYLLLSYIDRIRLYFLSYRIDDPNTILCDIDESNGAVRFLANDFGCNANKMELAVNLKKENTDKSGLVWHVLDDIPSVEGQSDLAKISEFDNSEQYIKSHPQLLFLHDHKGHSLYYYLILQHRHDLLQKAIKLHNYYYNDCGYVFERMPISGPVDDGAKRALLALAADRGLEPSGLDGLAIPYDINCMRQSRNKLYRNEHEFCDWSRADSDPGFVSDFLLNTQSQLMGFGSEKGLLTSVVMTECDHLQSVSKRGEAGIEQQIADSWQRMRNFHLRKIGFMTDPYQYFFENVLIAKKGVADDRGNFKIYFTRIIEWLSQYYLEKCSYELLNTLIIEPGDVLSVRARRIYNMICDNEPVPRHCILDYTPDRGLLTNIVDDAVLKEGLADSTWSVHKVGSDVVYRIECNAEVSVNNLVAIFNKAKQRLLLASVTNNDNVIFLKFSQEDFERRLVTNPLYAGFDETKKILEACINTDVFVDMLFATFLAAMLNDDAKLFSLCLRLGLHCNYDFNSENVLGMPLLVLAIVLNANKCCQTLLEQKGIDLLSELAEDMKFNPLLVALQRTRHDIAKIILQAMAKLPSDKLQQYFQSCVRCETNILTLLYDSYNKDLLQEFIKLDLIQYCAIDAVLTFELCADVKNDKLQILLQSDFLRHHTINGANLLRLAIVRGNKKKAERIIASSKRGFKIDDLRLVLACYCDLCEVSGAAFVEWHDNIVKWRACVTDKQINGFQNKGNYLALFKYGYDCYMNSGSNDEHLECNYELLKFGINYLPDADLLMLLEVMREHLVFIEPRVFSLVQDAGRKEVAQKLEEIDNQLVGRCHEDDCEEDTVERQNLFIQECRQKEEIDRKQEAAVDQARRDEVEVVRRLNKGLIPLNVRGSSPEEIAARTRAAEKELKEERQRASTMMSKQEGDSKKGKNKRGLPQKTEVRTEQIQRKQGSGNGKGADIVVVFVGRPTVLPHDVGDDGSEPQLPPKSVGGVEQHMRAFLDLAMNLTNEKKVYNRELQQLFVWAAIYHLLRIYRADNQQNGHYSKNRFSNDLMHAAPRKDEMDLYEYVGKLMRNIPLEMKRDIYPDSQVVPDVNKLRVGFWRVVQKSELAAKLQDVVDHREQEYSANFYWELLLNIKDKMDHYLSFFCKVAGQMENPAYYPHEMAACRMLVVMIGECFVRVASRDNGKRKSRSGNKNLAQRFIMVRNKLGHETEVPDSDIVNDANVIRMLREFSGADFPHGSSAISLARG
ncbi:MAG: hypothetical protein KAS93_01895 [Gammaproteobacteria bacterium]|nr:hypothetical protein [Gammaproteobacteria bacterium]